jgi:ABC-2 type transport system permease protein
MSDAAVSGVNTRWTPSRMWAVCKKEMFSYSISAVFYGVAIFLLLFTAIWLFFMNAFFAQNQASLRSYFSAFPYAFIGVVPALTMKSWSEERKTGSFELLATLPFSDWDLVLGKWLAAFIGLAAMLVLTIPLPLCLAPLGRFDAGVIVSQYLGTLLLGAVTIALGLFFSSFSRNQAGAFLASAVIIVALVLINRIPQVVDMPSWLGNFINFFSLSFHFESFAKGLLDTRDVLFFILGTFLFLFLNTRVLLFRRFK